MITSFKLHVKGIEKPFKYKNIDPRTLSVETMTLGKFADQLTQLDKCGKYVEVMNPTEIPLNTFIKEVRIISWEDIKYNNYAIMLDIASEYRLKIKTKEK